MMGKKNNIHTFKFKPVLAKFNKIPEVPKQRGSLKTSVVSARTDSQQPWGNCCLSITWSWVLMLIRG